MLTRLSYRPPAAMEPTSLTSVVNQGSEIHEKALAGVSPRLTWHYYLVDQTGVVVQPAS